MKLYKAWILYGGFVGGSLMSGMEVPLEGALAPVAGWERSSGFDEGLTSTAFEDDARGNWYIKRKFFIDARALYEQIKQRIPEVAATQANFLDMRNTVTADIVLFYKDIGFEPQELAATLTATLQSLEQERIKNMQLTEKERETYANIEMTRKELTQIQQDMQVLLDNEGALTKAAAVAQEQLAICASYEQQAWDKYERISEVLNDHLAEQLYRDIQSFLNHINAIDAYLKEQLFEYVNQVSATIRFQIVTIKVALQKLKEHGIALETQAAKELREKQKASEGSPKEEGQHASLFMKILSFFKALGYYIAYPFIFVGHQIARLWS